MFPLKGPKCLGSVGRDCFDWCSFLRSNSDILGHAIEHYLKAYVGKVDCTQMKMNWVISMSEQSGFPTHTPVLCSMEHT